MPTEPLLDQEDMASRDHDQTVSGALDWRPFNDPERPDDGRCILVWMPSPRFRSHLQVMRTGKAALIGGLFAFDCAEPTHWAPMPAGPSSAEPSGRDRSRDHINIREPKSHD